MALLLSIFLLGSCAQSLVYWDQARESFEKGAVLETNNRYAERLNVQGDIPTAALPNIDDLVTNPAPLRSSLTPEQHYREADEKITAALGQPGPLVKENKLGNAMTLKALTCWKTGQPDEARANAEAAFNELNDPGADNPRDKPLAKAVPGLVSLDEAYDSTKAFVEKLKELSDDAPDASRSDNEAVLTEGSRLYRKFISDEDSRHSVANARSALGAASLIASENEEIRRFFLLCELTGLKNRFDFWAQLNSFAKRSGLKADDDSLREWLDEEEADYLQDKDAALERLKAMLDGGAEHSVYRFWDGIL